MLRYRLQGDHSNWKNDVGPVPTFYAAVRLTTLTYDEFQMKSPLLHSLAKPCATAGS